MPVTINGTTGVIGPDGSASTPSYQGTDSNTGIFFPAADTIAFATAGTEDMRIDPSGNVGIGTSSPTNISGYTSLALNNGTNGSIIDLRAGGTLYSRWVATSSQAAISTEAAIPLVFQTNAAERARIASDGTFFMGQTTNPATATLVLRVATGSANGVNAQITSNTGTSFPWSNYNATGTYVGGISCTSTGTAFPTTSDYRLKHDIQPMTGALAKVAALKPVTYKWNLDDSHGEGFIAHELAEVVPVAVIGEKDAVDADGNPVYQGIDTSFLVATLTAAIQELKAELDTVKTELAALKGAQA